MKSIYLQKDKTVFDLSQYPAEEFAASMGLPGAPQIKFGNGNQKPKEKKRGGEEVAEVVVEGVRDVVASDDESEEEEEEEEGLDGESGSEDEGESGEEDVSDAESEQVAVSAYNMTSKRN
jgi:ATP-dependent RNA helicase DDX10/DBP4